MLRLDFTYADLRLPDVSATTCHASVSGVQEKVQVRRVRGGYEVVAHGGDAILKPAPRNTAAVLPFDVPINEHLTMKIAARHFAIKTAENELVQFKDGELAYLTRRFDRRDGRPVRQEDFCQLSGYSRESHGENYKYESSYEELAARMRAFCPSAAVENPKIFKVILFNYVFGNADAHLKNFSLYESPQGDFILTPFYDLLNTYLHFPGDPSATGLAFFADGHYTPRYEELGFYSAADFVELGAAYGVGADEVYALISQFDRKAGRVDADVAASLLSDEAKNRYLALFHDRLKAILNGFPEQSKYV